MAIGVLLLFLTFSLAFLMARLKARVVYGPPLPTLGQVAGFTLTNQDGRAISLADLNGQVWVADIIFTRCAGPCLRMSRQMKELQDALGANSRAKLVSLTTDADYDTPPVLKRYAEKFAADSNHWTFLTGTKEQIHDLAVNSLKLSAVEKHEAERESPVDLFVHSTIFVIVDKHARLRGSFDSTDADFEKQVRAAVKKLLSET